MAKCLGGFPGGIHSLFHRPLQEASSSTRQCHQQLFLGKPSWHFCTKIESAHSTQPVFLQWLKITAQCLRVALVSVQALSAVVLNCEVSPAENYRIKGKQPRSFTSGSWCPVFQCGGTQPETSYGVLIFTSQTFIMSPLKILALDIYSFHK